MKVRSSSLVRVAAFVFASTAMIPALSATAVVNGNANPNLAGRADGYACCSGDSAPAQSPTLASGLTLLAGSALNFAASGAVSYAGGAASGNNPDGSPYGGIPYTYGDGIAAPTNVNRVDALLGVFLGATSPTGGSTPAQLDFSGGLNFTTLAPQIGQVFFIGNGLTGDTYASDFGGVMQKFVVPTGATRLYLGTSDGFGWYNNSGSFDVVITAVPEPATWALLAGGLAALAWSARAKRGRSDPV